MPSPPALTIRAVRCRNYKPFKEAELRFAPLTLLFGHNTSGKSALVRLPLLVLRALSGDLAMSVGSTRFGLGFIDLIHGRDPHGTVTLGIEASLDDEGLDVDTTWQHLSSISRKSSRFVREFQARQGASFELTWEPSLEPGTFEQTADRPVVFAGLLPRDSVPGLGIDLAAWRKAANRAEDQAIYLAPHRCSVKPSYVQGDATPLGDDGSGAAHWLRQDAELAGAVALWYRKHLDVDLDVDPQGEAFRLVVRSGDHLLNAIELGEGAQQVLPIVTLAQALILGKQQPSLVIIEQPELHLHDAAQGAVADLLLRAAKHSRAPLVVETHSEITMLRVRRRIAEHAEELQPDDVVIYWVERSDGVSTATRMRVEPDGWVEGWPRTVYDVTFQEVAALQRATRAPRLGDERP